MLDVVKLVQQVKRDSFTSKLKNYFTADSTLEDMRKLNKRLKDHWKICSHAIQAVHFGLTISLVSSTSSMDFCSFSFYSVFYVYFFEQLLFDFVACRNLPCRSYVGSMNSSPSTSSGRLTASIGSTAELGNLSEITRSFFQLIP
jgi:hypothetical protein